MLIANEENLSQAFLQICRGTVLSGNVLILGRIARQMHNNLNKQILRGAAGISVNMCMFSDAYNFFFNNKRQRHVYFSVTMFKLTINVNINAYCVRVTQKKTKSIVHLSEI